MYNESENNDEEYMRQLYERFRAEVTAGGAISYYETDELLDIYDYAQDEGDAMVQMFVFLTASRLHPDNREFDERLAFFLSYVSQDSAGEMIQRGGRTDSALWDVLRMGVECFPCGNPAPYIDTLLEKYERLDSETLFKLIDLLRDLDRTDLLVHYLPALTKHAEDKRGFSFEVAETIKDNPLYMPQARKIAEQLTAASPFDIEAWLLLARIEFGLEHPEEALAAVDYALAIDPSHFNARIVKGVVLVALPGRRQEAITMLKGILEEDPGNSFALEGLAEAYVRESMRQEACQVYWMIHTSGMTMANGENPIMAIVELRPDDLKQYLEKYYSESEQTEESWHNLALPLIEKGKTEEAALFLDFFQRKQGFRSYVSTYLQVLYGAGMLERFAQVFETIVAEKAANKDTDIYIGLIDYLLLAATYLRLGHKKEAAEVAAAIIGRKDTYSTIEESLRWKGIILTARFIQTLATSPDAPADLADFDPIIADIR